VLAAEHRWHLLWFENSLRVQMRSE